MQTSYGDDDDFGVAKFAERDRAIKSGSTIIHYKIRVDLDCNNFLSDSDKHESQEHTFPLLTLYPGQPALWSLQGLLDAYKLLQPQQPLTYCCVVRSDQSGQSDQTNQSGQSVKRLHLYDNNIVTVTEWLNSYGIGEDDSNCMVSFISDLKDDDEDYDLPLLEDRLGNERLFLSQSVGNDSCLATIIDNFSQQTGIASDRLLIHNFSDSENHTYHQALFLAPDAPVTDC